MKTYTFTTQADVLTSVDVVVVGGGTAGVMAAISAAREGKKTAIIETFGSLGGSSTNGLVTPTMSLKMGADVQNSPLTVELDRRALEAGIMVRNKECRHYDPLALKTLYETMVAETGVEIYLYTTLLGVQKDGDRIVGVFVRDKGGIHVVEGKMFIDCTGDGDLSVMAGAAYNHGNPQTGKNQPISLRYMVGGVDFAAFKESAPESVTHDGWRCYSHCRLNGPHRDMERIMLAAQAAGDLTPEDTAYWQVFSVAGRPETLACNCPEFFERVDGTRAEDLTAAQLEGKRAIARHLAFYKKYFRGFENAYIAEIAPMVGIRESREIVTDYVMTLPEAASYTKYPDAIAQTNYSIDVHGFGQAYSDKPVSDGKAEKPFFEISYRSLVVKGIDNLLVAGRCIGVDFFVQAAIRIMPTCRTTGEVAGLAASLALTRNITPHDIDGAELRGILIERGAEFI